MAAIDHVLLAVSDLDLGAETLRARYGLTAMPGGRHPGAGTANMIVPLGDDYLELIAVVDAEEAARNPLSRRVSDAVERGATFATWAVRVPDLDEVSERLRAVGTPTSGPHAGSRRRPDGVLLQWRTLHVGDGLEPAIPFFLEWNVPAGEHPGAAEVEHPAGRVLLRGVRLVSREPRALEDRLRELLGEEIPLQVGEGDRDQLAAVVLDVNGEEREIT
jgi:Glyoxalase-like domain